MGTRRFALIVVVAALATGCGPSSDLARDAEVSITGVVRDGGEPLSGAVTHLRVEPSALDAFGGAFLAFGTVGLSCAAGVSKFCADDDARGAQTSESGAFEFEVTGDDVQDQFGKARTVSITTDAPPRGREVSGPAVSLSSLIQQERVDVGSLDMWRPELTFGADDATEAQVRWSAATHDGVEGYRTVFDNADGGVVWEMSGGGDVTFDPRVLEDTAGGVSVVAEGTRVVPGATATLRHRSPRLPFASGMPAPASRGASCAKKEQTCRLTDGDFATSTKLHKPAVIDLGRQVEVSLVVVRGCRKQCTIETSVDSSKWRELTTRTAAYSAFEPRKRPDARYIRVSTGPGSGLTEVSVWDGDPPPVDNALRMPEPGTVPQHSLTDLTDGIPLWVWITAGATAVIGVFAAGLALGRRRERAA